MDRRIIKVLNTEIVITETKVYVENEEPAVALNCLIRHTGGKSVLLMGKTLNEIESLTDRQVIRRIFEVDETLENYLREFVADILEEEPMYKTTLDFKERNAYRLIAYMIDGNRELVDEFVDNRAYKDLLYRINDYIIHNIPNYEVIRRELEDIIYELYEDDFIQDMIDNTFEDLN